jgi:hypothetical protein
LDAIPNVVERVADNKLAEKWSFHQETTKRKHLSTRGEWLRKDAEIHKKRFKNTTSRSSKALQECEGERDSFGLRNHYFMETYCLHDCPDNVVVPL